MEPFRYFQDLGRMAAQFSRRARLPKAETAVDYTGDAYRQQVRRVVTRLHPRQMKLRLTTIIQETPSARTFRVVRTDDRLPPWRAGQYINLHVLIDGVRTSRPYSISNVPGDPYLDITVRRKAEGFVSSYLFSRAEVGDVFISSGPGGHFHYEPLVDRHGLILIAGGSGITPMMAMIRDFARIGWPLPLHLIYGSRNLADTIFRDELDGLSAGNPNLNYALVLSEPEAGYAGVTGFISADLIHAHVGERDLARFTVLICGPNAMYDFVTQELARLPVTGHRVRRELYGPPEAPHRMAGWPASVSPRERFTVEVAGGERFQVSVTEPLLNSLERQGLKLRTMCRSGACSYCRVRLLSGEVFSPPETGLRDCDREAGYIHTCTSYPVSDLVIQL